MAKIISIGGPTQRGLNTVQTFLRLLIWLVSFAIFSGLTVFLSGVLARTSWPLRPSSLGASSP
jgi:hypothetical protein